MLIDIEEQRIWRGFGNREFDKIASMQDVPRIKRQYRGEMMQGHCDDIFERRRKAEFSPNAIFVEAGQHFGESCAGFHDMAVRETWHRQYADYLRAGFEETTSSNSLFTFPRFQSAMETSHFLCSDSTVNFTNSPLTHSGGSSRSRKRKFLFDGATRSVGWFNSEASSGSSDMTRFTRRLGANRVDTVDSVSVSASTFPVCDGSFYSRYNDAMIQPLNADTLRRLQNDVSNGYGARHFRDAWELCQSHPIVQSNKTSSTLSFLMPRRMLESECLPESAGNINFGLPNNSPISQASGMSSAATWFRSRSFQGENTMHPSFIKTFTDSYSGFQVGTYAKRHHLSEGAHGTFPANCRMQNSFEPLSRFMFRTRRRLPFRDSASRASQLVSPEAFAAFSRPQAALVGLSSSFVPVHGPRVPSFFHGSRVPSFFSESDESGRLSARPTQSHMPHRRRRERVNRQPPLSHELLNQSLEYEVADNIDDDQHSNMRLDVDDMSYEELLVLGERIGNVKTGLSVDSIQKCLKMSKHSASSVLSSVTSQKNEILCSICQEDYRENDELGQLVCGHSYHPACIKQWLGLKNQCPICKAVAYSEC